MKKVFQNENFTGFTLAAAAFLVYLSTLSPSIGYWDSAELAAVVSTLGITHPTGYPLFTLLGWAFAHFPSGFRAIYNLNLMGAIFCALAVFFFHRLFLLLLSERAWARPREESASLASNRIAAAAATMVLAFSKTYWTEALSLEVYALHLLFLAVVTLLFMNSLAKNASRSWLLFAVFLGLGFTHHMMTVLLAPAFLYLFFTLHGMGRTAWAKIGRAAIPFLIPLSLYLYLPLRSTQGPVMNWGMPDTFHRFWMHIAANQYRFKMFTSPDLAAKKIAAFVSDFPAEFGYAPLLLALLGLWHLFRHAPRLLVFSFLLFFTCVFYAVNYDFDDPNFYLNAYAVTAIWIAFGMKALLEWAKGVAWQWAAGIFCVALVFFPFDLNYRAVDESGNYAVEDYARNILADLEPDALVLSDDLQGFVPAAFYLQLVEKVRPDVVVIGHGILAYPWYPVQLEKRFPGLLRNVRPEIEAYLPARGAVERGDTTNYRVYSARFTALVQGILRTNYGTRPLYVTSDIRPGFVNAFQSRPEGLVLRLFRDTVLPAIPSADFRFRPLPANIPYAGIIRESYATGYLNQGFYRIQLRDTAAAITLFQKALAVAPGFPPALEWLNRIKPERG